MGIITTGPQGPSGPAGPRGRRGESGSQGPQGDVGPRGLRGPQGPAGGGNGGGEQGPQGDQGAEGPQGPQGQAGAAGSTGPQGAVGTQGPAGAQGASGPQGDQGPQGASGSAGVQGPAGPQGAAGSAGPQGATGSTGSAGPQGATGSTGSAGPQGATGSQGPQGANGGSTLWFDPLDYGATAGSSYDANLPSTQTMTDNVTAIQAAIDAAIAAGRNAGVRFSAFHWVNAGVTTRGAHGFVIEGTGWNTGVGGPVLSGQFFDFSVTGARYGPNYMGAHIRNLRIFGPCEYLPGGVASQPSTIGIKMHAAVMMDNIDIDTVNVLGCDIGISCFNVTGVIRKSYIEHSRSAQILQDNDQTCDAGGPVIEDCTLQGPNSGTAPFWNADVVDIWWKTGSAATFRRNYHMSRGKGGLFIDLTRTSYVDNGVYPQIEYIIKDCHWDSCSTGAGIIVRSAWGGGGAGNTMPACKLSGMHISGCTASNCKDFIDIDVNSGALVGLNILDFSSRGGGSMVFAGVLDHVRVMRCQMDSYQMGSPVGWSRTKAIVSTATRTNWTVSQNSFENWSAGTDVDNDPAATEYVTFCIECSDESTPITAATAVKTFHMPFAFTVTAVMAGLTATSSSGAVAVDINEAGSSILSAVISIDQSEETSLTAATPAVISDAAIAAGAKMTIDVDSAGTNAAGLKVYITGHK